MLSRTPSGQLPKNHVWLRAGRVLNADHMCRLDYPFLVAIDLRSECDTFRVIVVETARDAIQGRVDPIESDTRVVFQTLKASFKSIEAHGTAARVGDI